MNQSGLILLPSPLNDQTPLLGEVRDFLAQQILRGPEEVLVLVEDIKPGRRRWLNSGLPREWVEHLVTYNEHDREERLERVRRYLKAGKLVALMSDGGMPCLNDPGVELVALAHELNVSVRSLAYSHSPTLALALSGLVAEQYVFRGFPPRDKTLRSDFLREVGQERRVQILMDTPYRLERLLAELSALEGTGGRFAVLAMDLESEAQEVARGTLSELDSRFRGQKREFILVLSQI